MKRKIKKEEIVIKRIKISKKGFCEICNKSYKRRGPSLLDEIMFLSKDQKYIKRKCIHCTQEFCYKEECGIKKDLRGCTYSICRHCLDYYEPICELCNAYQYREEHRGVYVIRCDECEKALCEDCKVSCSRKKGHKLLCKACVQICLQCSDFFCTRCYKKHECN